MSKARDLELQRLDRQRSETEPAALDSLSPAARAAVAAGVPPATRRAYLADIRWFTEWCAATGHAGLPATAEALTEYASYRAYDKGDAPVSIERARWALLKWHKLAGLPAPSTDGLVSVLKGYRAALATAKSPKARPRKATPARADALRALLATLDLTSAAGQRNAAIILLGFAIAGRRGEIASLDITDVDLQDAGMQVSVYREKVRRLDDPVVRYRPDQSACPVHATARWIDRLASQGRTTGPLFVRINMHGQLARPLSRNGVPIGDPDGRMTGQAVAQVIQRCASAAGLSGHWSGHSLRRGFVTAAHEANISRSHIERQGGWEPGSRVVSGYIEDADRWMYDVLDGVL